MARLDDIPNEIVEDIVVQLELQDICSLRMCSRSLAAKATQDHFKSFFLKKKVDLTASSLEKFVAVTRFSFLGAVVSDLTLVGIVNNPRGLEALLRKKTRTVTEHNGPMFISTEKKCTEEELTKAAQDLAILRQRREEQEEFQSSGRDVDLLAQALGNIAAKNNDRGIQKLALEVGVFRNDSEQSVPPVIGGGYKYIWRTAADTYRTTMAALAQSRVAVGSLDIFNGPESRRCSIARNEISVADFDGLRPSLTNTKSLSLSLSDRLIEETDQDAYRTGDPGDDIDWSIEPISRDIQALRAEAGDESNFIGLARLVATCESVEELDLHAYNLVARILKPADYCEEKILSRLVEVTKGKLLNLTKCRLAGFKVHEQDLLAFVEQAPIKDLTLENVIMTEGSFGSIFEYCASERSGMEKLFFDDLFEERLVYFAEKGKPKFPSLGGSHGTNTLSREGEDVKKEIKYHFTQGRPLGSPQAYNWREGRRRLYGPP